jgi:hypothetical protein
MMGHTIPLWIRKAATTPGVKRPSVRSVATVHCGRVTVYV